MLILGDAATELRKMQPSSVGCIVTSPPYYGHLGPCALGREPNPNAYIRRVVEILTRAGNLMVADGIMWVVLGEPHRRSGIPIPWRVAEALEREGFYLATIKTWAKSDHSPPEYVFAFSGLPIFLPDEVIGGERGTVEGYPFFTLPEALVAACLETCRGPVLDPFAGSGTVGVVAAGQMKSFIGIEVDPAAYEIAQSRLARRGLLAGVLDRGA